MNNSGQEIVGGFETTESTTIYKHNACVEETLQEFDVQLALQCS